MVSYLTTGSQRWWWLQCLRAYQLCSTYLLYAALHLQLRALSSILSSETKSEDSFPQSLVALLQRLIIGIHQHMKYYLISLQSHSMIGNKLHPCFIINPLTCFPLRLVRLSSPNLNYLIGAGAIILYLNICFYIVPTTNPTAVSVLCNITPWLTALGYSLCYGTILAKMCRIYYIFNDPTPNRKVLFHHHFCKFDPLLPYYLFCSSFPFFVRVKFYIFPPSISPLDYSRLGSDCGSVAAVCFRPHHPGGLHCC